MTGMSKRTYLREVNPYLICPLCRGYLIDATTVVECLHSFCRSCILKHLRSEAQCPSCQHLLNKAKPNIKADKALQDIVYKLVPGLYHKEMRRRREFYKKHPEHADSATLEQRGEDVSGRLIFAPEDAISLSLEYLPPGADPLAIILSTNDVDTSQTNVNNSKPSNKNDSITSTHDCNRRYLQCPALVTIAHLKKFLALKYSVDVTRYAIEICHRRAPLPEHWTLMDVAYIYAWKRNAPLRFFYRIMQEEQRLEAPINDRPSTPGVGASLPVVENVIDKNESCDQEETKKEKVTAKPNEEAKKEDVKTEIAVSGTTTSRKEDKKSSVSKESAKVDKLDQTTVKEEAKQIKSPIKILKNSEGHYEVLKTSNNQTPSEVRNSPSEKKSSSPEFSVVSIGDGPNSNGVKITLKQCSPGRISSKPKIVSNVLMKNGQSEKMLKPQEKIRQKEVVDKQEKHKRKVTFLDKVSVNEADNEAKNVNKSLIEQSDKEQFLQAFHLTAKESEKEQNDPIKNTKKVQKPQNPALNSMPMVTEKTALKSPEKQVKGELKIEKKSSLVDTGPNNLVKNKSPQKSSSFSLKVNNSFSASKRLINGFPKDVNTSDNDPKLDVYAFPSEPPTLPAGAIKRKCPPGLPISDIGGKKRPCFQGQIRKKTPSTPLGSAKIAKKQEAIFSTTKLLHSKDNSPTGVSSVVNHSIQSAKPPPLPPTISHNTRNLLDGCGLNIPASLSITLTAPKSPSNSCSSADTNNSKDNPLLSGKVNPSITLNDRSVDPLVLKALKTGQIRMPVPSSRPKAKPTSEHNQATKRKRDDTRDILDLSGTRKMDIHPLRIPQPVSKFKSKPTRENTSAVVPASSQVVTLTGGQKYYRAPPGSLTPAVHRVADYSQPPPSRAPVYAPSCFSSPHNSNRSSNISSVFPSLQSLYALSQAPNLQQFQMDNRFRLPQPESTTSGGPGKSHLAAQCAPLKPARSSFASLAVPIVKQSSLTVRPITLTAGIAQANELIKNKGVSKKEMTPKNDNSQKSSSSSKKRSSPVIDSNMSKDAEKATEKLNLSSSSPISLHSKKEASASSGADSNSQEAASPRVSSTVSPSPPPPPPPAHTVRNSSVANSSSADEVSSRSICNKSGSEVTSSKSPESPDSSSVVNEPPNNASGITVEQPQSLPKEDKVDTIKKTEKKPKLPTKNEGNTASESTDKKNDNVDDDVNQMTSEVFQKRLLAAFPSNEWANNPIAAKHLGNLLKSLTSSMQTNDQTENTKVQSEKLCETIPVKCAKDILSTTKVND